MAKKGFTMGTLPRVVKDNSESTGWALCIGAGASHPIFPTWRALVERFLGQEMAEEKAPGLSNTLVKNFGLDALIQAAQERKALSDLEFCDVLVEELYADAKNQMNSVEWRLFTTQLSHTSVGNLGYQNIEMFLDLIEKKYPASTPLILADVIADAIGTNSQPFSILSFNAEILLYAVTSSLVVRKKSTVVGNRYAPGTLSQRIDLITQSTSTRKATRIPYFMCHGALPVPDQKRNPAQESIDKLVFSESSYLQIANSSFSWQSSVFLEAASSRHIIFVGISMSDPNIRRWLGWAHANRTREISKLRQHVATSTNHYWICHDPGNSMQRGWVESSVAHLGVRLVWISSWSEIGSALRIMIGLPPVS